jgi:lysophospholipase L1-like esterase
MEKYIMIWNQVLCLGDSLTYGARDRYGRSYPAELGKVLSEKTNEFYICHNYGINGETSSDLLRRSWNIIKSHQDCNIMLLWIGTNDTKIPTPADIYYDNLRQIINSARVFGMRVILGTIPKLTFSPFYMNNREYTKEYTEEVYKIAKDLCVEVCSFDKMEKYLIDGVHFTHEGNIEIAKRFSKIITQEK